MLKENPIVISADVNTLAIGADQEDSDGVGYVQIYTWDDSLNSTITGQSLIGEDDNDQFGWSIALSSD